MRVLTLAVATVVTAAISAVLAQNVVDPGFGKFDFGVFGKTTADMPVVYDYKYSLVVTTSDRARQTFTMRPTGCIRGELQFFDESGKALFSLAEGEEFPAGCGAKRVSVRGSAHDEVAANDQPVGVTPESVVLACTPDAYRLCFSTLLDRASAEACMRRNWALVSDRCKRAVDAAGIRR